LTLYREQSQGETSVLVGFSSGPQRRRYGAMMSGLSEDGSNMHGEGMGYSHERMNNGEQGGFGMSAGSLNGEVEAPEAVGDGSGFGAGGSTVQGEEQMSSDSNKNERMNGGALDNDGRGDLSGAGMGGGATQKVGLSDVGGVATLPSPTAGMIMNQGTGAMHDNNAPMSDSDAHRAMKSARMDGQADVTSQPGGGLKSEPGDFDQLGRGSLVSAPPPTTSAIYAGEAAPVRSPSI
jgi:hypothetical protein